MVGSITLPSKVTRDAANEVQMPELPEVEVVRRGLAGRLSGRVIDRVSVRETRLRWPVPARLQSLLVGQRLDHVERRGKYLLLRLPHGWLIVHLGMSGRVLVLDSASAPPPGRHDHVDIGFGTLLLRYHDPRRFGTMLWHDDAHGPVTAHPLLASLGVEPLSAGFDGALLYRETRGRRAAIKQVLLAGDVVVGVGNIYASECLFRAGIRPATPAWRVGRERCERLAVAIRETLELAISRGGSTLRDFVDSEGQGGYFLEYCQVYGRAGEPCRVCGSTVLSRHDQQRSTFWCPTCQS